MTQTSQTATVGTRPIFTILLAMGLCHLLNDMMQSVIPSMYPMIKESFGLTFAQIGIITLVFQLTSSILQPFVGYYADRHPRPYSLAVGMCFTLTGIILLAFAADFWSTLLSVAVIGSGSSIFHPEASRVAQMASGGRKGLAQSIFQVGGNGGSAVGPLLAAIIILPHGHRAVLWFAIIALLASAILLRVGRWYAERVRSKTASHFVVSEKPAIPPHRIRFAMAILVLMVFSKYFFNACMTSYFTFFLIDKFGLSVQSSQLCLFAYLAAFAAGTLLGGVIGDRYGRKYVILFSILGAAPFTLALPYLNLFGTLVMAILTGVIIASAFSAIVVYATDLMPDKVGMVAGVLYGLMFGLGGVGSAFFGWLADQTSVSFIFKVSTWLPLLGIIALWLPNVKLRRNSLSKQ